MSQTYDWGASFINDSNELLLAQSEASNHYLTSNSIDNNVDINLALDEDIVYSISEHKIASDTSSISSTDSTVMSEDLYKRLVDLEINNSQMKNEIKRLRSRIKISEENIDDHHDYIYFLQNNLARLDQYGRRENIEILGIPSRVNDRQLETEVLKILRKIGLHHLSSFQIVGCHRIGPIDKKGCRSTIVRFLNRKDAIDCLKNQSKLHLCKSMGYNDLSIVENLCPVFKSIYEDLTQLKNEGRVNKIWTYNGIPTYTKSDTINDKPVKVYNECELEKFFNSAGED